VVDGAADPTSIWARSKPWTTAETNRGATATEAAEERGPELEFFNCSYKSPPGDGGWARPQTREDLMRRIYHTMHFNVHDEKALHEFVRKHADPEEFSAIEKNDASEAEAGELVDHIYSDVEWIVENGHAYDAEGIEHTGGETGEIDEEDEDTE
jgi:hypothetical protein